MEQPREHCTTEGRRANVKATFQNFFESKLLVRTCVMLMELTHWFSEMVDKGDHNNCEGCPPPDGTDVQVDSKEDLDMTDLCPDSCEAVESVDHKPCGKTDNESPLVHDDINPSCNVSCNLVDELDYGQLGALFYHATSSLETISQMFIENDDTSDHTRNHTKQKPHTQNAKPSNINGKVPSSGRVIENILRKLRFMVKECESWLSSAENKTKFFAANSDLLVQDVPTKSSNVNVHASACQTTSPVCFEQSSQTMNECYMVSKGTEKYDEEAQFEREKLEQELAQSRETWKRQENHFKKQVLDISQRNIELTKTLTSAQDELRETLLELGRLSVENTKMIRENQTKFKLLKELQSKQSSTATLQPSSPQTSSSQSEPTLGAEALTKPDDQLHFNAVKNSSNEIEMDEGAAEHPPDHTTESAQFHGEESNDREVISLSNVPTTVVERSMYNNYKLLLFTMPPRLLFSDVERLKEFASRNYSIDGSQSPVGIFLELDRKGVISASNLTPLREFFEGALRFDLIHLIDCFLLGDYAVLRNTNSTGVPKNNSGIRNTRTRSPPSSQGTTIPPSQLVTSSASGGSNPGYAKPGLKGGRKEAESSMRPTNGTNQTFPVRSNSSHVRKSPVDMGSNGNKLSKFERSDSPRNQNSNRRAPDDDSDDDDDSQWLCSHYKRRCHVKFDCCDKYWPCHRCHNNESNCGQKKLKSRDTKFIKCVNCKTEQEFGEGSQFCVNCKAKHAKYFCSICKHLTGTDDHPYHCEKCGICRIHQNRSFHCDVCGVCLDVQLRGNHKCRAGSAHDECCICLEDAFTGCQILPCSHKVHKECATQMIRSGITRCPICRESFAHKLERRTLPPPKKHNGKK